MSSAKAQGSAVPPTKIPSRIKNWQSIINSNVNPPSDIVEGIVEEGSISLLVGRAKEGKSLLAAQLSIDVANGNPLLGKLATKKGRVLYIDYENRSHRIKARGQDLAQGHSVDDVFFAAYEKISGRDLGLDDKNLERLKDAVKILQPTLLVIDPLRLATSSDLKLPDKAVTVLNAASSLFAANKNMGILLIHHLIKRQGEYIVKLRTDPRAWIEGAFGSQALIAHVETIIGLERDNDELYTLATVPRSSEPIIWSLEKAPQSERFVLCGDDAQIKMWSTALQEGWKKLPLDFSWSDGVLLVGNSTLDRILRKAKPLGLVVQDPKTKRYTKI
jgi:archaellum biogenesis ATPase FlaH